MKHALQFLLLFAVVLGVILVAGCGGKFAPDNFNKVKTGMTEQEVIDLLGSPSETFDNKLAFPPTKSCAWTHGGTTYVVNIQNGKVTGKFSKQ